MFWFPRTIKWDIISQEAIIFKYPYIKVAFISSNLTLSRSLQNFILTFQIIFENIHENLRCALILTFVYKVYRLNLNVFSFPPQRFEQISKLPFYYQCSPDGHRDLSDRPVSCVNQWKCNILTEGKQTLYNSTSFKFLFIV